MDKEILTRIANALEAGDDEQVAALTQQAIDSGIPSNEILDNGLIVGMNVIGDRFRRQEIFIPDVLMAARAMYAGLELLRPLLARDGVPIVGTVVLGTVQGDLHNIGKNLVGIMLKGAGFEVIDLGHDVPPEGFVDTAVAKEASVIAMSALLTTTMVGMRDVVRLLDERGLRDRIKTIAGGAPVTAEFASEIGVDAYGFDAATAVERVKALVGVG